MGLDELTRRMRVAFETVDVEKRVRRNAFGSSMRASKEVLSADWFL